MYHQSARMWGVRASLGASGLRPQGPTQVHDKQAVHGLSKHLSVCEQSSRKLCWDQPDMKCLPASLWFEMVFCDYCI